MGGSCTTVPTVVVGVGVADCVVRVGRGRVTTEALV